MISAVHVIGQITLSLSETNSQVLWLYSRLVSRRNSLSETRPPNSMVVPRANLEEKLLRNRKNSKLKIECVKEYNYAFTIMLYKIASDGIVLIPEIRPIIEECKRSNKILKGLCIKYGLVETRLVPAD